MYNTRNIIESISNQDRSKADIKEMVYDVLSDKINNRLDECREIVASNYFENIEEGVQASDNIDEGGPFIGGLLLGKGIAKALGALGISKAAGAAGAAAAGAGAYGIHKIREHFRKKKEAAQFAERKRKGIEKAKATRAAKKAAKAGQGQPSQGQQEKT